jgi:hypothetical protein
MIDSMFHAPWCRSVRRIASVAGSRFLFNLESGLNEVSGTWIGSDVDWIGHGLDRTWRHTFVPASDRPGRCPPNEAAAATRTFTMSARSRLDCYRSQDSARRAAATAASLTLSHRCRCVPANSTYM